VGADAAGARPGGGRRGLESARLGPADRQDPPRRAAAGDSRLQSKVAAAGGPPLDDEYVYRVVDALDAVAAETGKSVPAGGDQLAAAAAVVATVIIGARDETQLRDNLGAVGWALTPAQVARARRGQRGDAALSLLASARLQGAQPAAGVRRGELRIARGEQTLCRPSPLAIRNHQLAHAHVR
jgi:hypothetical protein